MITLDTFGQHVRTLRIEKGLSQQQLADLIYVSRKTVSNWESGNRMPDITMLSRLADCLGVGTYELIDGIVDPVVMESKYSEEWDIKRITDGLEQITPNFRGRLKVDEDYLAGQKFGVPVVMPVDDDGRFYVGEGMGTGGPFSGMDVNEAEDAIYSRDLTDVTDILKEMLREEKQKKKPQQ